ncbi:MAG: glycosyltransferase [Nanoarchaeota archaeon]
METTDSLVGNVEAYEPIVGEDYIAELKKMAHDLPIRRVFMVNSTKTQGGVAVLLQSIVPMLQSLGIETYWLELKAYTKFFETTKSFHNGLQGEKFDNIEEHIAKYKSFYENEVETYNKHIIDYLDGLGEGDIVIIHDPQPLGLIKYRNKDDGSKWIWRCHIDSSKPDQKLWDFVYSLASQYDARIVSKEAFMHGDLSWVVIPPSIDPMTVKNRDMDPEKVVDILKTFNIPQDKPFAVQVSRLDKWKDPVGVIEAFRKAREEVDASLVLVYDGASDDPEGDMMFQKVLEALEGKYSDDIYLIRGDKQEVVNTFQRAASVVFQKSLKEGFALTVSEALWKATPVIATEVGGIPLQVVHDKNGYLLPPYEMDVFDEKREAHIDAAAHYLKEILGNGMKAAEMGREAKEHVRKNFLVTRHVRDYLALIGSLMK